MPISLSWVLILNRLSILTKENQFLNADLSCQPNRQTDWLTPWSWVLETLPVVQLLKNFPTLNLEPKGSLPCSEEPATDLTLNQISPVQSSPVQSSPYHPILRFLRSILLLSSHLRVGFSSESYMYPPDACHIPCPSHPPWLDHANYEYIWRRARTTKLLIVHFPPTSSISVLFGPDILLSTLFSNTRSLCSSCNARN
jgi:hypothetical protein